MVPITRHVTLFLCALLCWTLYAFPTLSRAEEVSTASSSEFPYQGWLMWRGPHQNGFSSETDLPDQIEVGGENQLWTYDMAGRGTPVIANGRLFSWGYSGSGPDLQEYLVALDAETGEEIWKHGFNDFLSDIVYERYSIGSPTVDPETGNVYLLTSAGLLNCFTFDGELLWQHSMMEEYGRLTFPNGRTGCPIIEDKLVIARGITSNWGSDGPGRDRFYAFDKITGDLVWSSTPGVGPQDSSFSTPIVDWLDGRRVFYAGTGCGNVVCVNARNGKPLWRYRMSYGGVNSTVLPWKDTLIAIHGRENLDSTEIGRMVSLQLNMDIDSLEKQLVLDKESERWRNRLGIFTSSPTLGEGIVFQTVLTGELNAVDPETGKILWTEKLGPSQLHASPLYADSKLYLPLENGEFFVIRPSREGAEILSETQLEGYALGQPSVWNNKIYVHSTGKLYCFGSKSDSDYAPAKVAFKDPDPGMPAELQIVPDDVLLRPGEKVQYQLKALDSRGFVADTVKDAEWEKYVPPTAKVKAHLDAEFMSPDIMQAKQSAHYSAGALKAEKEGLSGTTRGRILPDMPFSEGFEGFELTESQKNGDPFAYPPLPWIGARFKWEIHEVDGNKVLAKTLDRVLFQRAMTFFGHPDMSNYTVEADVMSDGNRRIMSTGGVINQRYIIQLVGNSQQLEVYSNFDRVQKAVPFRWKPKTWYHLKSRVDVAEDGSGTVRAKAWERGTEEPAEWTIEVNHQNAHKEGAPGLFGFSPQSQFRVYLDNIKVTSND